MCATRVRVYAPEMSAILQHLYSYVPIFVTYISCASTRHYLILFDCWHPMHKLLFLHSLRVHLNTRCGYQVSILCCMPTCARSCGEQPLVGPQNGTCLFQHMYYLSGCLKVARCSGSCRVQEKQLQGSKGQPSSSAVDPDLVRDLVEGQVSLAAALRSAINPSPALTSLHCCSCMLLV